MGVVKEWVGVGDPQLEGRHALLTFELVLFQISFVQPNAVRQAQGKHRQLALELEWLAI